MTPKQKQEWKIACFVQIDRKRINTKKAYRQDVVKTEERYQ